MQMRAKGVNCVRCAAADFYVRWVFAGLPGVLAVPAVLAT